MYLMASSDAVGLFTVQENFVIRIITNFSPSRKPAVGKRNAHHSTIHVESTTRVVTHFDNEQHFGGSGSTGSELLIFTRTASGGIVVFTFNQCHRSSSYRIAGVPALLIWSIPLLMFEPGVKTFLTRSLLTPSSEFGAA